MQVFKSYFSCCCCFRGVGGRRQRQIFTVSSNAWKSHVRCENIKRLQICLEATNLVYCQVRVLWRSFEIAFVFDHGAAVDVWPSNSSGTGSRPGNAYFYSFLTALVSNFLFKLKDWTFSNSLHGITSVQVSLTCKACFLRQTLTHYSIITLADKRDIAFPVFFLLATTFNSMFEDTTLEIPNHIKLTFWHNWWSNIVERDLICPLKVELFYVTSTFEVK